ncbi:hypothetical protein [Zunongwangia sp.]|uniref:hypothetical protein n=1 Tax=Zunongwangia sp. TaxID=1965325 RepID=UPI003AA81E4A
MKRVILIYDGTFNGFLTTIFDIYEERISDFIIIPQGTDQNVLFAEKKLIYTDQVKSKRVLNGIKKYGTKKTIFYLYRVWLSEITGVEQLLYRFCKYLFEEKKDISTDYSNPSILKIAQIEKKYEEKNIEWRLLFDLSC